MFIRFFIALAFVAIAVSASFVLSAFKEKTTGDSELTELFEETGSRFYSLSEAGSKFNSGGIDADSLKIVLGDAREAYKRIEFIINHFYPEFAEGHLNGAPLWHIQRTGTRSNVLAPEGLQYLDELIYSDAPKSDAHEIEQISRVLHNEYSILLPDVMAKTISEEDMVTAIRRQLITIATLGITGFDTPGSANGIAESAHSLETLQYFTSRILSDSKDWNTTNQIFTAAIDYLKAHNDFDSFDRAHFLKVFINPLYAQLRPDNSESPERTYSAWNTSSDNLFAPDFLDPYFYTELRREDDSPALQKLGETIFYDASLSFTGDMSCASCHNPKLAFTDGKAKSQSNVAGQSVERNAPTLLNAVYADRYFYDLRAFTLEQQAEHVVFNKLEFNTAYTEIIQKAAAKSEYAALISEAFPASVSDREKVTKALTSYVLSLQSFNSPFDEYMRGERLEMAPEVIEGFNLFMGKAACGTCHFAPTFSGLVPPYFQKSESEILGVLRAPESTELDADMGRIKNGIGNEEAWIYTRSFKTTTVRNAALTAPYFHNGAYASLDDVMDFYNKGGGAGHGLEVENQTLGEDPLNLSEKEISAIIAFMRSLTDNSAGAIHSKGIFN